MFVYLQKTFVTATTTRRKQQQEMIHRALLAEEDRRKDACEKFHMTTVPITQHAAYEPALHHAGEEHEEGSGEEEEFYSLSSVPVLITLSWWSLCVIWVDILCSVFLSSYVYMYCEKSSF